MMISKCSRYCVRSPSDNWASLNSSLVKLSFRADLALVNDQTACDNSQVCGPWIMVDWEMTCVSRWAFTHSSHLHPLCTDIRSGSHTYTEGDGHIGPFLIIFNWLAGCRIYHSWAQLLYLMVRVLDHSIHLSPVSFQIVLTEDWSLAP